MTNTVNLQKMLQTEAPSTKKLDSKAAENPSGDDFKSLMAEKTEDFEPAEEIKVQEKKPEPGKQSKDQKEKEELNPGEAIPLADLLLARPEVLSDAEKAVVMAQISMEQAGQNDVQRQDGTVQDETVQNGTVQNGTARITNKGLQEAIKNGMEIRPEMNTAPKAETISPAVSTTTNIFTEAPAVTTVPTDVSAAATAFTAAPAATTVPTDVSAVTTVPTDISAAAIASAAAADIPKAAPAAPGLQSEIKMPDTQAPMANQPSAYQEAASQAVSETPVAEIAANRRQKAEKYQSQVINNSEHAEPQHVDKPQEKQIIVDKQVLAEEKPVEPAKDLNPSMNVGMEKNPEEKEPEGKTGEIKDLTQLSAEEKTDKEGKPENVLSSDVLKPETLQKEVVKIKVAEPYDRLNTETVKDLANKLTEQITNGKREFTIQLNPEMLGRIAVKISMADDGIKVTLSCDRQKTCQLLAEQASGINRIVEHNTGHPAIVEVKEGYWEQQKDATDQHARQNQNQQQNQQEKASKAETDDFIQQLRLGFLDYRISV